MTDDDLQRQAIAQEAFDGMAGIEPGALEILAQGLRLAEQPLGELSEPLSYYADVLASEDVTGRLAVLRLARSLRLIAAHPGCPELLDRLEGMDHPPWLQIRNALEATNDGRA